MKETRPSANSEYSLPSRAGDGLEQGNTDGLQNAVAEFESKMDSEKPPETEVLKLMKEGSRRKTSRYPDGNMPHP